MDEKLKLKRVADQLAAALEENRQLRIELIAAQSAVAEERHMHALIRVEWERVLGALPNDMDPTRFN